jgi:tetratricopeptide (TPR) repeat protein
MTYPGRGRFFRAPHREKKAGVPNSIAVLSALACEMSPIGPRSRITRAFAVLGFAVLGAAAAATVLSVRRMEPAEARKARRALAAGLYDAAGLALARWLKAMPDASEAHLLKGRVAVALGRLPEAADELKRAHALGHAREEVALLQALIATKLGRHAEAKPALTRAFELARAPDRQVDEALARVYLETYDLVRGAEVLDCWARDFPDDPKPYLWRAEVHSRTGSDPGVLEVDYREALRRDPALARARLGLAEELRQMHRSAAAAVEYDAYLALEPNDAVAHLGAGRNLMELGDEAGATRHLNRAIELDGKSAEPLKELAEAAARRGDWAATLVVVDRAIALDPFDLAMRQRRGLALHGLGRVAEGRAEQAEADRLRKDLAHLHGARSRLIASPHDRAAQLEVARWMFDHAHDQEGARWAEKILSERPEDPEASRLLADYHQRRGETGLANFYRLHAQPGPKPSAAPEEINTSKQSQTTSSPHAGQRP